MGKFDALAKFLGLSVKEYGDDAAKILSKVDNPDLLKGTARTTYKNALNEINSVDNFISQNPDILYHSTPSKNLKEIEKYGLIPQYGPLVKSTESYQMANEFGELPNPATYFSEQPSAFYGMGSKTPFDEMTLNKLKSKAASIAKKREDDIYQLVEQNHKSKLKKSTTDEIKNDYEYGFEKLPAGLESKDYFTIENQRPERIFKGLENIELLTKKEKDFINMLPDKQRKYLESIKDLPSNEFQKKLKEALSKDKNLAVLGIPVTGAQLPQTDMSPLPFLKQGAEAYESAKEKIAEPLARQLNIGKNPQDEAMIKSGASMIGDPLNYISGPIGAGLAGIQIGTAMLPSEKEMKLKALKRMSGE